jgi:hypothetical protein
MEKLSASEVESAGAEMNPEVSAQGRLTPFHDRFRWNSSLQLEVAMLQMKPERKPRSTP